ncbi:ubiquitin carboxyl-terminal hydrolase 48-like [Clavelina lepadiformis]|uniref:ubiquitin carboxyl-terminal hydrolase 48-like n=1 Tax=Clavelina lepadiformis TaxID=159417 RepID=UPI004041AD65
MGKKGSTKSVESQIWQWTETIKCTEITAKEVRTSYRLSLTSCKDCRKNCIGNPRCLDGLGESYWLNPGNTSSTDQNVLLKVEKENEAQRRQPGELVGLRNLGATCYVNTYLQLWFHNLDFRKALFQLNEPIDSNFHTSICGQLQLIFGLLQSGAQKCVDPSSFIECLGLATDLQQDAQEFSKLLLSVLETIPGLSGVIEDQFSGKYAYVTTCQSCKMVNKTPSRFYELDLNIQGHKDLKSCILEFLQQEHLKGENQYFCDNCQSKQNAVRQIVLQKLPKTLSIQLLRFVYDRASQRKHKLSTLLSFPDKLEFSSIIGADGVSSLENSDNIEYQLSAVLIHRGPSASSGHFIAHILDSESGNWYKFNDEVIVKMKGGKNLDLDSNKGEDDIWKSVSTEPPAKRAKVSKGSQSSKDVYMLVYSQKFTVTDSNDLCVPSHIQTLVDSSNTEFETELSNGYSDAKKQLKQDQEERKSVQQFLQLLNREDGVCEFVPTSLLKQLLNPHKPTEINRKDQNVLCVHGNLSLEKVSAMKYIPKAAADMLYSFCNNKGVVRISEDMMCRICVETRCLLLQAKAKLVADYALVQEVLKSIETKRLSSLDQCFYVGRHSLRKWRSAALKNILEKYKTAGKSKKEMGEASTSDHQTDALDSSESDEKFYLNRDIICDHGYLMMDMKLYQPVPLAIWEILQSYFPDGTPFLVQDSLPCAQCAAKIEEQERQLETCKAKAQQQRAIFSQLFSNKNRPTYENVFGAQSSTHCETELFFIISEEFLSDWREFVRCPERNQEVTTVKNEMFLCPHRKLLYDLGATLHFTYNNMKETKAPECVFLWEEEWKYIKTNFIVDYAISFCKTVTFPCKVVIEKMSNEPAVTNKLNKLASPVAKPVQETTQSKQDLSVLIQSNCTTVSSPPPKPQVTVTSFPDMCVDCMEGLAAEDHKKLCTYANADVFVLKSTKTFKEMQELRDDTISSDGLLNVPMQNGQKRNVRSRRSTRGEKKLVNISSDLTLKELKVKIMMQFSVPPFDQNLWLNGKLLVNDDAAIGSLSITPGCTLTLVEDTPNLDENPIIFETTKPTELETGFKGTGLLGFAT